jgi:hypothetical protein
MNRRLLFVAEGASIGFSMPESTPNSSLSAAYGL